MHHQCPLDEEILHNTCPLKYQWCPMKYGKCPMKNIYSQCPVKRRLMSTREASHMEKHEAAQIGLNKMNSKQKTIQR